MSSKHWEKLQAKPWRNLQPSSASRRKLILIKKASVFERLEGKNIHKPIKKQSVFQWIVYSSKRANKRNKIGLSPPLNMQGPLVLNARIATINSSRNGDEDDEVVMVNHISTIGTKHQDRILGP
ncbi:hypothetical protein H6P81_015867 [Aristolochia fimbriata]|uniref:Ribosomal protein S12 n=1 Tax=Aristolochia fimbriata TaxID=158543 RepID=A0AAV7E9V8_ARIFI|nr:hypothetical protein H6P81_015867 [Aristolochia fimbriata]